MSKYANRQFWSDTLDRVIATVAQSGVAVLTADATGLLDVDWQTVASVSGLAGAVALLTSVAFRGREAETPAVVVAAPVVSVGEPDLDAVEVIEDDGTERFTLVTADYVDPGDAEADLDGTNDPDIWVGPEQRGRYAADQT